MKCAVWFKIKPEISYLRLTAKHTMKDGNVWNLE